MRTNRCYIERCLQLAQYVIEWYGFNQHGQNPEVADERSVCDNFYHLVEAGKHEAFGGFPDGIVDSKTLQIEHPILLERVIKVMEHSEEQLELF